MTSWNESEHPRTIGGRFASKGPAGEQELTLSESGQTFPDLVPIPSRVQDALADLRRSGMRPVLVGGSVRDALLGYSTSKDLDFEVYGADQRALEQVLARHGKPNEVGRQFAVTTMRVGSTSVDFSLPRTENKTGSSHRDFAVVADGDLTFEQAASRRDFTVNAMMWDPGTGELIDPHGGYEDLRAGVLRHVSDAFDEDPLRVMRGARFASRFDLVADPDTMRRCRNLADQYSTLPDERIQSEFDGLARAAYPGRGLEFLRSTGWAQRFPGGAGINDGTIEQASRLPHLRIEADRGVHLGAVLARGMDDRLGRQHLSRTIVGKDRQQLAMALSRDEMPLPQTASQARHQAHQKLSIRDRADHRFVLGQDPGQGLEIAEQAGVADRPEPDLVNGNDAMSFSGRRPGPWLKDVLAEARSRQADGEFGSGEAGRRAALDWLGARLSG